MKKYRYALVLALAVASSAFSTSVMAQPMATNKNSAAQSGRSASQIMTEIAPLNQKISQLLGGPGDLYNAAHCAKIAPDVLPLMKQSYSLLDELKKLQPQSAEMIEDVKHQLVMYRAILGDQDSLADLKKLSASGNADDAAYAKTSLIVARWVQSADPAALADLAAVAKAHPASGDIVSAVMLMRMSPAARTKENKKQIAAIVSGLTSPNAEQIKQILEQNVRLAELEGKPIQVAGKTLDGKAFNLNSLQGKVVLVDFWATWCGPCVAEMPEVIETYKKYHDQGFEIVGVSNDNDANDLKMFLSQNPGMKWVQLFEPGLTDFHPETKKFGIVGIPTMFLIDRKGNLRSAEARENMSELIPVLLAEK